MGPTGPTGPTGPKGNSIPLQSVVGPVDIDGDNGKDGKDCVICDELAALRRDVQTLLDHQRTSINGTPGAAGAAGAAGLAGASTGTAAAATTPGVNGADGADGADGAATGTAAATLGANGAATLGANGAAATGTAGVNGADGIPGSSASSVVPPAEDVAALLQPNTTNLEEIIRRLTKVQTDITELLGRVPIVQTANAAKEAAIAGDHTKLESLLNQILAILQKDGSGGSVPPVAAATVAEKVEEAEQNTQNPEILAIIKEIKAAVTQINGDDQENSILAIVKAIRTKIDDVKATVDATPARITAAINTVLPGVNEQILALETRLGQEFAKLAGLITKSTLDIRSNIAGLKTDYSAQLSTIQGSVLTIPQTLNYGPQIMHIDTSLSTIYGTQQDYTRRFDTIDASVSTLTDMLRRCCRFLPASPADSASTNAFSLTRPAESDNGGDGGISPASSTNNGKLPPAASSTNNGKLPPAASSTNNGSASPASSTNNGSASPASSTNNGELPPVASSNNNGGVSGYGPDNGSTNNRNDRSAFSISGNNDDGNNGGTEYSNTASYVNEEDREPNAEQNNGYKGNNNFPKRTGLPPSESPRIVFPPKKSQYALPLPPPGLPAPPPSVSPRPALVSPKSVRSPVISEPRISIRENTDLAKGLKEAIKLEGFPKLDYNTKRRQLEELQAAHTYGLTQRRTLEDVKLMINEFLADFDDNKRLKQRLKSCNIPINEERVHDYLSSLLTVVRTMTTLPSMYKPGCHLTRRNSVKQRERKSKRTTRKNIK